MKSIAKVIDDIFAQGDLPSRIELLVDIGPIRAGSVLTWSSTDQAYMHTSGRWVIWALTVRRGWGIEFKTAQPVQASFDFVAA